MKIGISIEKLYPGKIGGAEQYVRNIISIIGKKRDIELVLFLNESAMSSFENEQADNMYRVCVPDQVERMKEYYEYYIAKYCIQVLFCPLFYLPCESFGLPIITSILDIQHEYYPEYFQSDLLQYRREETQKAIENSSAIITISEFSKETMIEKLNVKSNKIFVTHLNADRSFETEIDIEKNKVIQQSLPKHYIFYPANGWAHKNHKKLIDAYQLLKERYDTKCKLVLTGNSFNEDNNLQTYIEEKGLVGDVIALGYIDQEDMPYVFANAEMLVFPSLFEGFGIPLVEAMRMGTPIACSDCGSIPEVAGNAAIIFDAQDENDIAKKMHLLECDLKLREELRQKGYQRATAFSWEKCAEQTLQILKKYAKEEIKVKQEFSLPKVTIILPVFSYNADLWKLLESIRNQMYPDKNIVLFSPDRHVLRQIRQRVKTCSVDIKLMKEKSLKTFFLYNTLSNAVNIIGVLQVGQVFTDMQDLENIVVELIKNKEEILWIKPKKEGFWGTFLDSRIESKKYQKFIQYDQAVHSISFVRNVKYLKKICYWFNGHYQQILCGNILKNRDMLEVISLKSILDKNLISDMCGNRYRKSLLQLWKKERYISQTLINTKDEDQKQIEQLVKQDANIQQYYRQIDSCGIEFSEILMDGWISRFCELEIEINETESILSLSGVNSDITEGVILTVWVDQQKVICENIDLGEFQLKVKIPVDIMPGRYILCLETDKTFSYYERTKQDVLARSLRFHRLSVNDNIIWER